MHLQLIHCHKRNNHVKVWRYGFFLLLLHSSFCGLPTMSCWRKICRLALFYGNGVYCVFLLMYWKLGTSKRISERNKVGAYTLRVYTWHKCALSSREGAYCAIHIYLTWRRLLHLYPLDSKVP